MHLSTVPPTFAITFLSSTLPAAIVAGRPLRGSVRVSVTQTAGDRLATGSRVPIDLSFEPTDSTSDSEFSAGPTGYISGLVLGRPRVTTLRIAPKDALEGTYTLTASVDPQNTLGETQDSAASASSPGTYTIANPYTLLSTTIDADTFPANASAGDKGSVTVEIDNYGNIPATGLVTVSLSAYAPVQGTTSPLGSRPFRIPVAIGPGKSRIVPLRAVLPASLAAGEYWISVATSSASTKLTIDDPVMDSSVNTFTISNSSAATGNYFSFSPFVATDHSGAAGVFNEAGTIDVSGESSTYTYTDVDGFGTLQIYGPSTDAPFTALNLDFDTHAPTSLNRKTLIFLASAHGALFSGTLSEGGSDVPDAFSQTSTAYFKLS
jgi:hypothetical protein